MGKVRVCLLFAAAVLLGAVGVFAQQTNVGNITGTVLDASGAVLPGADVTAVNQGTNVSYHAVAGSGGDYVIELLPIGRYTVTVTKAGFKTASRPDIDVLAGETFTANISLEVGATTQTITVKAGATVINTTDTNQGTTRSPQELEQLPISMEGNAARAAVSAVQTLSGVNYNLQGNSGQAWMVVSRARINGIDGFATGYEIDGVESGTGEPEQGEDFMAPVPDAVQEIRLTNNTDASQGFSAGQSVAMVMKSGTNDFHGSLYYYNRNDALEARPFFLPNRYEDKDNEFGLVLGGPVIIPHVYNGRNKTFFLGTFDVFRYVTTSATVQNGQALASVPTLAERNGNFTDQLGAQLGTDALGRPVYKGEIYDPNTSRNVTAGQLDPTTGLTATSNGFVRDPFQYGGQLNVVNPNRLSPVSQYWASQYLNPTQGGTANNWAGAFGKNLVPKNQWSLKIDQAVGDKIHIMFSTEQQFSLGFPQFPTTLEFGAGCYGDHVRYSPSQLYVTPLASAGASADCREQYRYRTSFTWAAKPNVLVSLRAGITRDPKRNEILIPSAAANGGCNSGLASSHILTCWTPRINITNLSPIGNNDGYVIHSQRTPVSAAVDWTAGKHLFSFGADYLATPFIYAQFPSANGTYSFGLNETGLPGTAFTTAGAGVASFMLGEVDSASLAYPQSGRLNASDFGMYGQDKWRVTQKLTVTYGLRWEVAPPAHEHDNKISTFNPSEPNPGAGGILGALSVYGTGPGENGLTQVGGYYLKALAPKIGIAYAYDQKTVIRANYGVSFVPLWGKWLSSTGSILPQDGFGQTLNPQTLNGGVTPAFQWDGPFPQQFPASFPVINPSLDNGTSISEIDTSAKDIRPPMFINIGTEVERQLPGSTLLRVAYIASIGHRMYADKSLNQFPLQDLALGSLLQDNITNPAVVAAGYKPPYPGFNSSLAQALRPYPQYTNVTLLGDEQGNTNYQSMQINVQRHFGGFTFLANATFSKLLNLSDTGCACAPMATLNAQPQSIFTPDAAKMLAPTDLAKQMNISWFWDLPVGHGKRYLAGAGKLEDEVLGNWRVSAIQSYQGGYPISLSSAGTPGYPSQFSSTGVDTIPGVAEKISGGCGAVQPGTAGKDAYLNPGAFEQAPPFTLANTFVLPNPRACAYLNEDVGLDKGFALGEHRRLSIGAMFTNAFNRHQFNSPTTSITSAAFGQFTNTSYPRTVQLYGKFVF